MILDFVKKERLFLKFSIFHWYFLAQQMQFYFYILQLCKKLESVVLCAFAYFCIPFPFLGVEKIGTENFSETF